MHHPQVKGLPLRGGCDETRACDEVAQLRALLEIKLKIKLIIDIEFYFYISIAIGNRY